MDSAKLAERLDAAARNLAKTLDVLIEINVGGEDAKSGVAPSRRNWDGFSKVRGVAALEDSHGLMTVPPFTDIPQARGPACATGWQRGLRVDVLSMGMSHDFEVAVEEGSTCVRIGTAIFGERTGRVAL